MKHVSTVVIAALLAAQGITAHAQEAPPDAPQTGFWTASYGCENGMVLDAAFVTIEGMQGVIVSFPDGRSDNVAARRLLPSTQTGSGVRYASDITEFHTKGREASFETAASAASEAIPRTQCRELTTPDGAPLTQAAQAGTFAIASPLGGAVDWGDLPYRKVENVCFAANGSRALALIPTGVGRGAKMVMLDGNGRLEIDIEVGPVDAGVGQRYYALSDLASGDPVGMMHFFAPGMAEPDAVNADAQLTRVTLGEDATECQRLDDVLYAASTRIGLALVAKDGGALVLTIADSFGGQHEMRGAHMRRSDALQSLYFFADDTMVQIGFPVGGHMRGNLVYLEGQTIDIDIPQALFHADPATFDGLAAPMSDETAWLLEALPICNHFAGEWSGDPERGRQIAETMDQAGCERVDAAYDAALASDTLAPEVKRYLENQALFWR